MQCPLKQLIRQAIVVIISEKNASNAPVIIAPIMLTPPKSTVMRTSEVSSVPNIPVSNGASDAVVHLLAVQSPNAPIRSSNTKKVIAIPKKIQKSTAGIAIVAVIVSMAVIVPIMRLAIIARKIQLNLRVQVQVESVILIHLRYSI